MSLKIVILTMLFPMMAMANQEWLRERAIINALDKKDCQKASKLIASEESLSSAQMMASAARNGCVDELKEIIEKSSAETLALAATFKPTGGVIWRGFLNDMMKLIGNGNLAENHLQAFQIMVLKNKSNCLDEKVEKACEARPQFQAVIDYAKQVEDRQKFDQKMREFAASPDGIKAKYCHLRSEDKRMISLINEEHEKAKISGVINKFRLKILGDNAYEMRMQAKNEATRYEEMTGKKLKPSECK